uniref:Uncharacterized protein n=1 Tax=Romanomermis culicivorax TaxID=13658 RepID=A0A915HTL8_ROMCU
MIENIQGTNFTYNCSHRNLSAAMADSRIKKIIFFLLLQFYFVIVAVGHFLAKTPRPRRVSCSTPDDHILATADETTLTARQSANMMFKTCRSEKSIIKNGKFVGVLVNELADDDQQPIFLLCSRKSILFKTNY